MLDGFPSIIRVQEKLTRLSNANVVQARQLFLDSLIEKLAEIEVALATSLRCALSLGWMVRHRLDSQATGTGKTVEDERRTSHHTADRTEDTTTTL